MPINGKNATFKLPSDPHAVFVTMMKEVKRARKETVKRIEIQAARTAWKILCEWVHIQITMIQMEQAEAIQVFLPYAFDGQQTFYERLKGNEFRQLTQHKE